MPIETDECPQAAATPIRCRAARGVQWLDGIADGIVKVFRPGCLITGGEKDSRDLGRPEHRPRAA